jgi:hypothetical protein
VATDSSQQTEERGRVHLAFALDEPLRERTEQVLAEVRGSDDRRANSAALAALVVDLTKAGLDYYFLRPLEQAEVGFLHLNAARVGLRSAGKSIPLVVNNVLGSLSNRQLVQIAEYVEDLLLEESP